MLAPISWLKDYTDNIPEDINIFCDKMTLTGTKVEGYEYRGEDLENIVTARIEEIERHPDSDHMWVCRVFDGKETYTIVTGAQNVKKGDIVPLARDNSVVAGGKKIKESSLRGIKSSGMLCSGGELGMSSSVIPKSQEDGIYILDSMMTEPGVDIKEILALNDYTVDFELTNNRQDCNSILGIAAEASASFGKRFAYPQYEFTDKDSDIDKYLRISVNDRELCPRYTAKMVRIKKIAQSPLWIQNRLMAAGVRPINNVVDVSNFVMLETGQPLHTFDYDKLAGKEIVVDRAAGGQKFVTLDGTERTLSEDVLMINDGEKAVAIAGIMGGGNSDIDKNTKSVVIEAANFNKLSIRRSSSALGLRSEASAHFEKGISPKLTKIAADRAVSLLVEIGAAEAVSGVIDICGDIEDAKPVKIDMQWFNRFAGVELSAAAAADYLALLNFSTEINGDELIATPFMLRSDIEVKQDLAEEILRMYGYEKIPLTMAFGSGYISDKNRHYALKQHIKDLACGVGAMEILTYSFISPTALSDMGFAADDLRSKPIEIRNPLGVENSVMRTSMIPNMLDVLKTNYNKKNLPQLMFEIGNVYLRSDKDSELPAQNEMIAFGKYNTDFYELKAVINYLGEQLRVGELKYVKADEPFLHPGRSAYIFCGRTKLGFIGQIHPLTAKKYDVEENIYLAEIDLENLCACVDDKDVVMKPVGKYPAIERDLAIVCDESTEADALKEIIFKFGGKHIVFCEVFDVYRNNEALGEGKKSVAFNILFRSDSATLTDESIDKAISKIVRGLAAEANAILR